MGSLMAGWNCPVQDPETAWVERNRSLTKEEIESFWRLHRRSIDGEEEGEELRSPRSPLSGGEAEAETGRRKTALLWGTLEKTEPSSPLGKDAKLTGDWWTRSNWAFLNEPPLEEEADSAHKYTAQFHIAQIATAAPPARETTLSHDAAIPRSCDQ